MMSVVASMMKLNRETAELRNKINTKLQNYSLHSQLPRMTETHAESLQEHVSTSVL